jgi:tRNA threonylcarbamoyladenosine biosynthesis protein TsaE
MITHSYSPENTIALGNTLGMSFKGNEIVCLHGGLGVGKTLFTKGIAQALGIHHDEIISPTFTIMNQFYGKYKLFHLDLYRIGENISFSLPEIDDNLEEGVIVVEWAQFLPDIYQRLPNTIQVHFILENDFSRIISIE